MILEAANEGAQSLPSRILDAQRVNEESVTRNDLLTVSDSDSEDETNALFAAFDPRRGGRGLGFSFKPVSFPPGDR